MPTDFVGWLNRIAGALLFGALVAGGLHLGGAAPAVCAGVGGLGGLLVLAFGANLFFGAWRVWEFWDSWR